MYYNVIQLMTLQEAESVKHRNQHRAEFQRNLQIALQMWPNEIGALQEEALRTIAVRFSLSIAAGELLLIGGRWYVTHAGLLRLAERRRCAGIEIQQLSNLCTPEANRWVFRAVVYKFGGIRGFVGYGDADPSNVTSMVRGAEMRVAETRAVNRALRKAYGIGICSVEELGVSSGPLERGGKSKKVPPQSVGGNGNGNGNGQPRLRDRLCLLIRQHHLDPTLVKRFAADFCHVHDLRQASREQVEELIKHLGDFAAKDPGGLAAKLNNYAEKQESAGAA
jgi:hypothetical protein